MGDAYGDLIKQFVDATNQKAASSKPRSGHSALWDGAYAAFTDEEGFAAVATLVEIAAQGHSLSIPRCT